MTTTVPSPSFLSLRPTGLRYTAEPKHLTRSGFGTRSGAFLLHHLVKRKAIGPSWGAAPLRRRPSRLIYAPIYINKSVITKPVHDSRHILHLAGAASGRGMRCTCGSYLSSNSRALIDTSASSWPSPSSVLLCALSTDLIPEAGSEQYTPQSQIMTVREPSINKMLRRTHSFTSYSSSSRRRRSRVCSSAGVPQ